MTGIAANDLLSSPFPPGVTLRVFLICSQVLTLTYGELLSNLLGLGLTGL